jgi:biopolymer transport protein ExbD
VVGQKTMNLDELKALLEKTATLYPQQAVILRADQKTYHERVVNVLNVCAEAKIWNISFATTKEV